MYIGERVHALRMAKRLTLQGLADQCQASKNTIHRVEHNQVQPLADLVVALARAFGCSTDYLLGCTETAPPADPGQEPVVIDATQDHIAVSAGRFEHYNARPNDWSGIMYCLTFRPKTLCTCGRYRLQWTDRLAEKELSHGHHPAQSDPVGAVL